MESEHKSVSQGAVIGIVAIATIIILALSYVSNLFSFIKSIFSGTEKENDNGDKDNTEVIDKEVSTKSQQPKQMKNSVDNKNRDLTKSKFTHMWLATSFKSHTGTVSDISFSPNGKYLASCADDRSIYVWLIKDYLNSNGRSIRVNVGFDHATRICFSPDNKAFLVTLFSGQTIRVYKMTKKADGSLDKIQHGSDFEEKDTSEVISMGIASNGRFIMTCYNNTIMKLWDLKGTLLTTINSHQVNHSHGAVSPCGRFVACSGFTPEVKVWEVCFTKTFEFKEVVRAFQLGGHSSSIYSFAFNTDSTRMATVSKDGSWKLWDTNIDYKNRQDPKLLQTWPCSFLVGPSHLALSPNGLSVAIANNSNVYVFNVHASDYEKIPDVHPSGVTGVEFSPNNQHLAVSGGRVIYLFNNIKGHQALIDDLKIKLKTAANSYAKERIQEQISSTTLLLKGLLSSKSEKA